MLFNRCSNRCCYDVSIEKRKQEVSRFIKSDELKLKFEREQGGISSERNFI